MAARGIPVRKEAPFRSRANGSTLAGRRRDDCECNHTRGSDWSRPLERDTIRHRGQPRPPHRPRRVVSGAREERRAHARRLGAGLRRRGAAVRGPARSDLAPACTWSRATARGSPIPPLSQARPGVGRRPALQRRATTCATRRCRRRPGEEQLRKLAGRVFSQQLDRSKPLWEIWLVDRVGDDRFAMICKTHHALVDGISGVDIMTVLFDLEPEPPEREPGPAWYPRPEPSGSALFGDALIERAGTAGRRRARRRPPRHGSARGGRVGGEDARRPGLDGVRRASAARPRARSTRASARTGASPGWTPTSTASRRSRARSAAPSTTSCSRSSPARCATT